MRRKTVEEIYRINQDNATRDIIKLHICGITYPEKSYEIIRDNSELSCIEYIQKGTGTVEIDGKVFHPEEGDSYFLQAGRDQHYYSDKINPWKKIFINISGNLVESLTEGYNLKNIYYYKGLDLHDEMYEIINVVKRNNVDNTEKIIFILNKIFLKMSKHMKNKYDTPDTAERMKEFLRVNAASKFKINQLCEYVSLSESQTIKIFKDAYGITPYAYFLDKKINLAKSMLLNTNLTIKQIAYDLNFTDEYYFSNVFKKKTGESPLKFRNGIK